MGIQRGKKKCLEALRVTGVVAASTGACAHTQTHTHTHTHTYTHTHGGSWPALGKQDLVLARNPEDLRPGSSRNPLRWTHSAREDWHLYMKSDLDSLPCWLIR